MKEGVMNDICHMRIPDLDLDQVRCFVTVVESGGLRKLPDVFT